MLNLRAPRGFTIIELMVAVTIFAILVALALPSFSGMIQNSKLGSAAKSYSLGIQTARTAAIRLNLPVDFVLTNSAAVSGVESSAVPAANGKNWVVRYTDPVGPTVRAIEVKSAQEGSGAAGASSVQVAGAATAPAVFNGVLTFNGLGGTSNGEVVSLYISNPLGGACAASGGPMRCQLIQVRPGGQINLCDPNVAAGDSRACPP